MNKIALIWAVFLAQKYSYDEEKHLIKMQKHYNELKNLLLDNEVNKTTLEKLFDESVINKMMIAVERYEIR